MTLLGCTGVSGRGPVDCGESPSGTLLSNGCSGDEVDIDGEASLSGVATGGIGSKTEDDKDSSFVRSLSNCCSGDDEVVTDVGDSSLMAGIGATTGFCFQGSSTCSLTESNAADTQRSKKYNKFRTKKNLYQDWKILRLRSEPEKLSVLAASVSILTSAARLSSRSKIFKISR